MKKAFFVFFLLLLPLITSAQFAISAFFRHRVASIAFTSTAQNLYTHNCSDVMTVENRNSSGVVVNVSSDLTLNLTATGTLAFYDDLNCTNQITSVKILAGTSSVRFYVLDTAAENAVATVAASGYQSISQAVNVTTSPFIWMGGGGNASWNTALNWSGGVVPGNSDVALFLSSCVSNCSPTLNVNVNVAGLRMLTGYTGTLTQSSGSMIVVGFKGWTQQSGNFIGSNSSDMVIIYSRMVLSNGVYTATRGTTQFNYASSGFKILNSPTFNHNSGTWQVDICSYPTVTPGNLIFNNFLISNACNWSGSRLEGTLNVTGTFTIALSNYQGTFGDGGVINLSGNLVNDSVSWGIDGRTWLKLAGTAGSNVSIVGNSGTIGSVEIASLGTVNFSNRIVVGGSFKYTSGTVNVGTSNFQFGGSNLDNRYVEPAGLRFYDVTMAHGAYAGTTLMSTLYVDHDLFLSSWDSRSGFNGGSIEVKGNVSATTAGNGGTIPIIFKGSANQTLSATTADAYFYNAPFTINTSSGAIVRLSTNIDWTNNAQTLTITSGGMDLAGYKLSVKGLTLNGNTLTRNGGVLSVNGTVVGAGVQSVYGGTVNP